MILLYEKNKNGAIHACIAPFQKSVSIKNWEILPTGILSQIIIFAQSVCRYRAQVILPRDQMNAGLSHSWFPRMRQYTACRLTVFDPIYNMLIINKV